MKGKIGSLSDISKICTRRKKSGKTVALITGCFDIIHTNHINLFKFAKKTSDLLVVGVDSDKSVKLSKGDGRPVNKLNDRLYLLSELEAIDFVFPIAATFGFDSTRADMVHRRIANLIRPDFIISNPKADSTWRNKVVRAKEIGAKFLPFKAKSTKNSTKIIATISKEL